jgi:hypothetical protein
LVHNGLAQAVVSHCLKAYFALVKYAGQLAFNDIGMECPGLESLINIKPERQLASNVPRIFVKPGRPDLRQDCPAAVFST